MRTSRSAFTLIELLIVIAIIVVLVSLFLPFGNMLFRQAEQLQCQKQLAAITQTYLSYTHMRGQFPPMLDESEFTAATSTYRGWLPPQYNYLIVYNGNFRAGFGPLVWHDLVPLDYLICPKDKQRDDPWWHSYNRDPQIIKREIEEGAEPQHGWQSRTSYGVRCFLYPWTPATVEGGSVNIVMDHGLEFGRMAAKAILACRISTATDVAKRHQTGAPVGYIDGSVEYRTDRVLWDNNLTGEFQIPEQQQFFMREVWGSLDKR
jgi:prepilin-type N-terminal cleavage/methylation domain-containing protein/prepilin-type processing-associated H-X9-DG protein